jgi:IgA Peptidase M64
MQSARFVLVLLVLLCAKSTLSAQTFPTETLLNNGPEANRVIFVFLSDGYQSGQLNTYITNATNITNNMMGQSPFLEYENFFNVYAVKVPSTDSGAKHAGNATDVAEPASPVTNPTNYFGSRFDVSSIHRLLSPANSTAAFNVATANKPGYDQILVLVNDPEYGGAGGTLATCSTNGSAAEIMIHEVGHSFANLADEYWFNCAERPNRTANNNPTTIIWKNWLGVNGIGINAYGTSAPQSNCFRPHNNCKMRFLGAPFCSVCKEAFIDKIYSLVSPIDAFTPASNNVAFTGPSMNFDLDLVLPNPNTLKVRWVLNGLTIANNVESVNITAAQLVNGNNTLTANVTDSTLLSRSFWPATSGYLHSVTWTVNNTAAPVELLTFDVALVRQMAKLSWQTATESGSDYFEVERSENGADFYKIGQVKAAGNSSTTRSYYFNDQNPLYGVTYYRLHQVDKNGDTEYSPIRTVNRIGKVRYEVFPNPTDAMLYVQITGAEEAPLVLELYGLDGRLVRSQRYDANSSFVAELSMVDLPAGSYVLFMKIGNAVHQQIIEKQ